MAVNEPGGWDAGRVPSLDAGDLGGFVEEAKWPKVIGVLSIVQGSLGVLANGCCGLFYVAGPAFLVPMMEKAPRPANPPPGQDPRAGIETMTLLAPWMAAQGVLMLVTLLTSVLLLVAGIQMVMRRPAAVGLHKLWAGARLLLGVLGATLAVVTTFATAAGQAEIAQKYGGFANTPTKVILTGALPAVVITGLILAYPIVVLVVLRKPWAKSEVAKWKSGGDLAHEDVDFK